MPGRPHEDGRLVSRKRAAAPVEPSAAQDSLFSDAALALRREGPPPAEVVVIDPGIWANFALRREARECGSCHLVRQPFGAAVVEEGKPSTLVCLSCTVRVVTERRRAGLYVCDAYAWVTEALSRRFIS